jgi:hypothetical protein
MQGWTWARSDDASDPRIAGAIACGRFGAMSPVVTIAPWFRADAAARWHVVRSVELSLAPRGAIVWLTGVDRALVADQRFPEVRHA